MSRWRAPNYVNRPEHNNLYLQLIGNPPANLDPLFAVGVLRIIINADDVRLFEDQIDGITDRLERLRAPAAYVQVFREIEHMADDEEEDEDEDEDEEDEEDQEDDDQEGIF
ncbi:hypothetical protein H2203_004241 [Taxawa tesnikishii (nom. ined.)]|nr:hypothetical protein H2203_004241 [Dothideales sp. JES 119]